MAVHHATGRSRSGLMAARGVSSQWITAGEVASVRTIDLYGIIHTFIVGKLKTNGFLSAPPISIFTERAAKGCKRSNQNNETRRMNHMHTRGAQEGGSMTWRAKLQGCHESHPILSYYRAANTALRCH